MIKLRNPFRRSPPKAENQSPSLSLSELEEYFVRHGVTVSDENMTAATYLACMDIRCKAIAKIPFKVKQRIGDDSQVVQHSLSELLGLRPNPFTAVHDFIYATELQRIEYGNAFWAYDFNGGKIKALYLLDSTNVEIIVDNSCLLSDRFAVYYVYHDAKFGDIIYPADRLCHFKNFSRDGIVGVPMKHYITDLINQEKYGQKIIKTRYEGGLQDPLIVTYTGDLTPKLAKGIQKKFEMLGGASNAGKVIPIPPSYSVQQLETKLVNSQFFELSGLTSRNIANAFGVKSFQLNDLERSTYANVESQNRAFYSETLQNVITGYEQEITYKLLSSADRLNGLHIEGNADVMLRSDIETRYRAYSEGIAGGFLQIAEVRKKEHLPFVEGTDMLIYGNGAAIPVSMLGTQYQIKKGDD